MSPLVSVIIVNFNGEGHLAKCLPSLKKEGYKNEEVILVDNASSDDSVKTAKKLYPGIKIIENKSNLGFAKPNNQGLKYCKGKYVLLLNNDTVVGKNFIGKQVKYLEENPDCGATQGRVLRMDDPTRLDSVGSFFTNTGFLFHYGFGKEDTVGLRKRIKLFSAKGCALMLRKSVVDRIGLFDDSYFAYFEESDLCWRIWLNGYSIYYIPEVSIKHVGWGTTSKLHYDFILFHSYKNRITTMIKNLGAKRLLYVMPVHIMFCLAAAGAYLVTGRIKYTWAIVKALCWSLVSFPKSLEKRRSVQSFRKVSDEEFLPELTRKVGFKYFLYLFTGLEKYTE